jgi:putative FmdB family regulatory protein
MPIYEYKCNNCGHEYELIQKMSDAPNTECENCHKNSAQRLVSAPGFQLKGTGWYETDFKNKGKPKVAPDNASASTDVGTQTTTKETVTKGDDK